MSSLPPPRTHGPCHVPNRVGSGVSERPAHAGPGGPARLCRHACDSAWKTLTPLSRTSSLPSSRTSPSPALEGRVGTGTSSSGSGAEVASETQVVSASSNENSLDLLPPIMVTEIGGQHNIPEQGPARVGATGWAVPTGATPPAQVPEAHFSHSALLLSCSFSPSSSHLPLSASHAHFPPQNFKKKKLLTTPLHLQKLGDSCETHCL